MANAYFTPSGVPATNAAATSSTMRAEFNLIEDAFDLLPTLSGNGSKMIAVNSGASALEAITTTGTGSGVRATSPTLTTPTIGVATATSINKVAITAPATSATLTIADGKTLTASNTLTFTGTDASSVAFGTGGTVLYSGGALGTPSSGTLTNCTGLPISTGVSGLAANVATFLATPSSANLISAVTDETGTGALVFANSPTLVTPALGAATATSVTATASLSAPTIILPRVDTVSEGGEAQFRRASDNTLSWTVDAYDNNLRFLSAHGGTLAIGAPITATTVNGLTLTTSTGTLTITNGKTLSASNTLTFTGTDGTSLNINAVANLNSGRYTPTGGTGSNVSAVTPGSCHWIRVGNEVTVSGTVQVTTSAASVAALFTVSLPVASNFAAEADAAGVISAFPDSSGFSDAGGAKADTINDIVQFNFYSRLVGTADFRFTFTYQVI